MASARPSPRRRWAPADWAALLTVTAVGGLLRFYRLTRPDFQIFDERIYVKDACFYVHAAGRPPCFDEEITTVHPPLGKWLIGWGLDAAGFTPLGWRIAAAVAGTLTVALVYLLARALLRSTGAAIVGSGLFGIDFLHFVHSRVGMLDVFITFFAVAAFVFVVYDRRAALEPEAGGRSRLRWSRFGWRPWRIAAGAAAGLASATKWSGLLVLGAVVLFSIAWEVRARARELGSRRAAFNRALVEEGGSLLVGLLAVPLVVYSATFLGRLDGSLLAWPWSDDSFYRALWDRQFYMYEFHRFLMMPNWAQSPVWSWPVVMRPIPYAPVGLGGSDVRFVFGGGNPLVWWASLVALAYVALRWWRVRDPAGPEGIIAGGFALGYFPWFVLSYNRPNVFLYYMLPVVPFMCLALAYVALRWWRTTATRVAAAAFLAGAAVMFVLYHPLLTAERVPAASWHARMWIYDDCEAFFDRPATFTTGVGGSEVLTTSTVSNREAGVPAEGWCGL
jgi:dolichyl-phosphate-mannose-protein mannosyltransferase